MLVRSVLVAPLSLGVLTGSAAAQPAWFDQAAADHALGTLRSATGIPAISAAVRRLDTSDVGTAVSGHRRAGEPAAVTSADRFHIGSNTKAFTSTAIAHLVESGVLSWDSTIESVLGDQLPVDQTYRDVTLRDLLSLRGGTPPVITFDDTIPYLGFPGSVTEQRAAIAGAILSQPRIYQPGQTVYSNASYVVAAAMAEHASGVAWEDLVQDSVLAPLGITAEFGWPGQDGSDQPWGHADLDGDGVLDSLDPLGPLQFPAPFSPAGNLSMTMSDLALFGQQHFLALSGLSSNLGLTSAEVLAMHDSQGFPLAMGWTDLTQFGGFGEGWIGSTDLFTTILLIDRDRGLVISVGANGPLSDDALFAAVQAMAAASVPTPSTAALALLVAAGVSRRRR